MYSIMRKKLPKETRNDICQQCVNALCGQAGKIQHAAQSYPDAVYAVQPNQLLYIGQ